MSYDIHGDNGNFVAGGPSIGGLSDLKNEFAAVNQNVFPQIKELLDSGYSRNPTRLMYELQALSKHAKNADVKKTCVEMANACRKCKEVVILHNHLV